MALDDIARLLEQVVTGQKLQFVLSHGDFNLSNLLINPSDNKLCGIVDWDLSETDGLPLLDIFHLILSRYRFTKGFGIGKAVTRILFPHTFDEQDKKLIEKHRQELNITDSLYQALAIMYWVKHSFYHIIWSDGNKSNEWMKANYFNVIEYLKYKIL